MAEESCLPVSYVEIQFPKSAENQKINQRFS